MKKNNKIKKKSNKFIKIFLILALLVFVTIIIYEAVNLPVNKYNALEQEQIIPARELVIEYIPDECDGIFFTSEDKPPMQDDLSDFFEEIEAHTERNGKLNDTLLTKVNGCKVTAEKGADSETVRKVVKDIGKLDSNMIKVIDTVTITPESLAKIFNAKIEYYQFLRGASSYDLIYLNDRMYGSYVLIHEAFHNIDCYSGGKDGPFHYSEDYTKFYEEYVVPNDYPPYGCYYISEYKPGEYFVGMGLVWYMAPQWLKEKDPVIYEFYESHFGELFKNRSDDWELDLLNYNKLTKEWGDNDP